MKFAVSFAALALLAPSAFAQTSTLEEKWAINDEPTFTYDSLDFTLTFAITDFIVAGQADHEIYTEGCREEGDLVAAGAGIIDTGMTDTTNTVSNTGVVNQNQQVTLQMSVDPTTIRTNPDLYSEDTTIGDVSARIRFCVRFFLNTGTGVSPSIEVNFLEAIITLDVDLSDGFQISNVAVEPRDKLVRTAAQAYLVEGYLCGTDRNALAAADLAAVRNQGALIRVCVRPDADARSDGVYMRAIDEFTWNRDTISQEAVVNRLPASNSLTALFCTAGEMVCYFETILFAAFYTTVGTVSGNGVGSMQFGGNGDTINAQGQLVEVAQRALRAANNGRKLQEGEDAATSEFDLSFDVDQGTLANYDDNSGAGSIGVGAMAMTLIGLVGVVAM